MGVFEALRGMIAPQRTEFFDALHAGEQGDCPMCGRYAQMYRRRLHAGAAIGILKAYQKGGASRFIHTSELIDKGMTGAGDFSKAKYWNLIEAKAETEADKRTSGYWRLTPAGVEFAQNGRTIQEWAHVFDDRVYGFSGAEIDIEAALGVNFSYSELIGKGW